MTGASAQPTAESRGTLRTGEPAVVTDAAPLACVLTLGCAKNEVDSDKMRAELAASGIGLTDEVAAADVAVVNTCAFLASAVEEGIELILDVADELEGAGRGGKLVVAGCMPSRYGADLAAELTEVDAFVDVADEKAIAEVVLGLVGRGARGSGGSDDTDGTDRCDIDSTDIDTTGTAGTAVPTCDAASGTRTRHDVGPYSYVKISEGCDRRCTYCMIPAIRGGHESRPMGDIVSEVAELARAGTSEIVFIAQDTGAWGRDLEGPPTLSTLLATCADEWPKVWFRILYVQPDGVTDELLETIASHGNICPYIDMPLQHASGPILRRMGRSGSAAEFLDMLSHMRSVVPDLATRTTFMTGFPGEGEDDFEELLDFAYNAEFDFAGVFAFSREEGSAAALLDGQVDAEVKLSRAQQLLDAAESVGTNAIRRFVGREMPVLVEGYERTDVGLEALCRSRWQAPEVDGQVHVPIASEADAPIGSFLDVRVTDTFFFEWEAECRE